MAHTTNKKRLIKKLHDSSGKFVAVITGGGLSAMADILSIPGPSRTVLEDVSYTHLKLPTTPNV